MDRLKTTGGFLIFLTVAAVYSPFWNSTLTFYQDNLLLHLLSDWNTGKMSFLEAIGGRVSVGNGFGPLTMMSYLLDFTIFGSEVGLYHLTGILLHALTCVFIYMILIRLNIKLEAAFWTTLIFSLHPLHSSTIGWLQARGELLAGFFAVAALFAFVEYVRTKKIWPVGIAAVITFFAILANERLILLPVLLFVFMISRTKIKENLLQILVYAVILSGPIVSYSLFRLLLKNPASPSGVVGMNLFYNAHIIPETIARFFIPVSLPIAAQFTMIYSIIGLLILGSLIYAGIYTYRKNKVITFFAGLAWFISFMIPGVFTWMKLGDVQVYFLSSAYVALVGMVLPAASLMEMLQSALAKYYSYIVIAIVVIFFGLTVFTGSKYINGDNFWKAFTQEQPENLEVYRGKFVFLLEQSKIKEAEQLANSILKSFGIADVELNWFVQRFESKEEFKSAEQLLLRYKREIVTEGLYHDLIRNLILCGDLDLLPMYLRNKKFAKERLLQHLDGYITYFRTKGKLEFSQKIIIGKSVIERTD